MYQQAPNKPQDRIVTSFEVVYNDCLKKGVTPIITLFWNPLDHPNKFVARLFEVKRQAMATPYIILGDSREGIEKDLPAGMVALNRDSSDHPTVVCSWI